MSNRPVKRRPRGTCRVCGRCCCIVNPGRLIAHNSVNGWCITNLKEFDPGCGKCRECRRERASV